MDGLLLIDKPEGVSSFDVIRRVRRIAGVKRVGHGGTLDPFASGLLTVALGSATRLLEYLLGEDKIYRATMRLGQQTDTQDLTGRIVCETRPDEEVIARLEEVLPRFVGEIEQTPPMYSALKKDGVPLYKLARRGEEVDRRPRRVQIHALRLGAVQGYDVSFEVHCSKGTYVRTLAHDIGQALGCGAHLRTLRRLAAGAFHVDAALRFDELETMDRERLRRQLHSPLQAMAGYPVARLDDEGFRHVCNGRLPAPGQIVLPESLSSPATVCLAYGDRLAAVAEYRCVDDGNNGCRLRLRKVFSAP
ncbi:tRNA pseudouridine synthase B [Geothermobacter ehrlichii]|uniref:tRNA pseudouridine synthase B n=1 Tax=Geothermobacter ehrlichii TaxID=213224 RepID=A0A5D3WMJ3_9BACT|nr:tRNA pseudouridine(55) synthase TruB [Geothermobacter ehrlichii]TYO99719.1 tRNA pseudouridine synthase B [Geothermobacter ehrlichii]